MQISTTVTQLLFIPDVTKAVIASYMYVAVLSMITTHAGRNTTDNQYHLHILNMPVKLDLTFCWKWLYTTRSWIKKIIRPPVGLQKKKKNNNLILFLEWKYNLVQKYLPAPPLQYSYGCSLNSVHHWCRPAKNLSCTFTCTFTVTCHPPRKNCYIKLVNDKGLADLSLAICGWYPFFSSPSRPLKVIHRRICLILGPGQILLDYLGKRLYYMIPVAIGVDKPPNYLKSSSQIRLNR